MTEPGCRPAGLQARSTDAAGFDLGKLIGGEFGGKGKGALMSVANSIDTRSAAGRLVLNVLASVSQWEREIIVERTTDAMQHLKTAGKVYSRPLMAFDAVCRRQTGRQRCRASPDRPHEGDAGRRHVLRPDC